MAGIDRSSPLNRHLVLLNLAGHTEYKTHEGTYYALTENGRQYLAGDRDAGELEDDQ